jgi:hypothetical protein
LTEHRPERCVIVVDQALPPGLAGNAAAVLALSVGATFSALPGQDLVDADGSQHPGLIPMGLPVLAAPGDRLTQLRTAALDAGLHVVDFPAAGQQTTDYHSFVAQVARTPTADLGYLGVALSGSAKRVRKLTGGFSLLR